MNLCSLSRIQWEWEPSHTPQILSIIIGGSENGQDRLVNSFTHNRNIISSSSFFYDLPGRVYRTSWKKSCFMFRSLISCAEECKYYCCVQLRLVYKNKLHNRIVINLHMTIHKKPYDPEYDNIWIFLKNKFTYYFCTRCFSSILALHNIYQNDLYEKDDVVLFCSVDIVY